MDLDDSYDSIEKSFWLVQVFPGNGFNLPKGQAVNSIFFAPYHFPRLPWWFVRTTYWHILLFTYLSTYSTIWSIRCIFMVLVQGNKVFQCPCRPLKDFDKEGVRGSYMQAILVKITLDSVLHQERMVRELWSQSAKRTCVLLAKNNCPLISLKVVLWPTLWLCELSHFRENKNTV